jgi:hypothetical protein
VLPEIFTFKEVALTIDKALLRSSLLAYALVSQLVSANAMPLNQLVDTNDLVELTFIEHDAQFNTTRINLSKSVTHDVIHRLVLNDYVEYSEPNEL